MSRGRRWFAAYLARTVLHTCDIDAVLEMPAELFDEWRLLFNHEPWGEERLEYLLGFTTAALVGKGRAPSWYMPFITPPKREMSGEEMKAVIKGIPGVVWSEADQ